MDLISVIVPVYNVEKYLERCVDSIRRQSYSNLEIILVDDGSPDNCPQMCEDLKRKELRIKVVHKENGGLGFARNSGLDVATGTYVTFIDSDDWISVDHIQNLYRCAIENNADVVVGSHTTVTDTGEEAARPLRLEKTVYEGQQLTEKILLPLIGADITAEQDIALQSSACMNLYKTSVITDNGLRFRSEKVAVAEDLYFNIDYFYHAKRIVVTDEVGYYYFENHASISRKYDPKRFLRTVNFYHTIWEQLRQYSLTECAGLRANRMFLMKVRVAIRHIVLSELPQKEKFREIKAILENETVKQVLKEYPIDSYIPAMRLLMKQMRRGSVQGVYFLMKAREGAKQSSTLKRLLRKVGIGK